MIYDNDLEVIIKKCIKHDLYSQELLYRKFYSYAMSICLRYCSNRFDARNVVNEGFLKVFINLEKYDSDRPFKGWMGKIMTNTAIDYYRMEMKRMHLVDLNEAEDLSEAAVVYNHLEYQNLLELIQKLSPAYRAVFNLYAIDGYTHEEIAKILNVSEGTSKSNLFKARKKLQELLKKTSVDYKKVISISEDSNDLRMLKVN